MFEFEDLDDSISVSENGELIETLPLTATLIECEHAHGNGPFALWNITARELTLTHDQIMKVSYCTVNISEEPRHLLFTKNIQEFCDQQNIQLTIERAQSLLFDKT